MTYKQAVVLQPKYFLYPWHSLCGFSEDGWTEFAALADTSCTFGAVAFLTRYYLIWGRK